MYRHAGTVTLALMLSACASQQQPPAPPPLKLVTETPHRPERDAATTDRAQLLAQQPAEVQAAIKEHRARRQVAGLPNRRVHALSLQPRTRAGRRLRAAAHHRHSAAAGRDDHRRCDGRYGALDGDAGRLWRSRAMPSRISR